MEIIENYTNILNFFDDSMKMDTFSSFQMTDIVLDYT